MRRPTRLVFALGLASLLQPPAEAAGNSAVEEPAWFELSPALTDGPVAVSIRAPDGGVQGWSFALCHERPAASLSWFRLSEELSTIRNGRPPNYVLLEEAASGRGLIQAVVLDYATYRVLPTQDGTAFPVLEASYLAETESTLRVCGGLSGSGQAVDEIITLDGATHRPQTVAVTTLVPSPEAWFSLSPEISNRSVTAFIHAAAGNIQGWSFGLCHDPEKVDLERFGLTSELMQINAPKHEPDFWWCGEGVAGNRAGIIQAVVSAPSSPIPCPRTCTSAVSTARSTATGTASTER